MRIRSRIARSTRALRVVTVVMATGAVLAPVAQADDGPSKGAIVFASYRADLVHSQLWAMLADGSGQTQLTSNPSNNGEPEWSPDRRKLAFLTNRDFNFQIYLMNPDGSGQRDLFGSNSGFNDADPAWSPNGRKIAFSSDRGGTYDIYVVNADGSGPVTRVTHTGGYDELPTWSPDGKRIAFDSDVSGKQQVYVVNVNGSHTPANVSNDPAHNDYAPDWSPNGRRIAFVSDRDVNDEIYSMEPDGSEQARLTHYPLGDRDPAWSPDSRKIAFARVNAGVANQDIYVMPASGDVGGATQLTNHPADDLSPDWLPNPRGDDGRERSGDGRGEPRD